MNAFPIVGVLFCVLGLAAVVAVGPGAQWTADRMGTACADGSCLASLRITAGILAATFLPLGAFFVWMGIPSRRSKRASSNGLPATATVLKVRDSGVRVQGYPWVELDVQVAVDGMPQQIATTGMLMRGRGEIVTEGQELPVTIDPGTQRVTVNAT